MTVEREKKLFNSGFASGYQGDNVDKSHFNDAELIQFNSGFKSGEEHFGKVLEIMEITGKSLREIHQFAIDKLYFSIRENLRSN